MAVGVAVVSAVIPGVLWLWVFTHGRSYRGAPLKILLITFFLGMLSVIPAGTIEFIVFGDEEDPISEFSTFWSLAVAMFFVVGPVEETSKFLAVRLGVYRTRHLREPLDGLIYGAAASLGFATAENIGYAITFGPEVMIVRGPVSTLGHVVFGSIWALSLNPGAPAGRRKLVGVSALAAASFLHGLFNVLAFSTWGILPAIGLVIIGGLMVRRTFRRTKRSSTYHLRRNIPLQVCTRCSTPFRSEDNFCHNCGLRTDSIQPILQQCANCRALSRQGADFCASCGDLFVYED